MFGTVVYYYYYYCNDIFRRHMRMSENKFT